MLIKFLLFSPSIIKSDRDRGPGGQGQAETFAAADLCNGGLAVFVRAFAALLQSERAEPTVFAGFDCNQPHFAPFFGWCAGNCGYG